MFANFANLALILNVSIGTVCNILNKWLEMCIQYCERLDDREVKNYHYLNGINETSCMHMSNKSLNKSGLLTTYKSQ